MKSDYLHRVLASRLSMARINAPNVLQGVFAINKPTIEKPKDHMDHMSSQKVLDEINERFNNSSTFQPLLEEQRRAVSEWKRKNNRRPKGPNRKTKIKIGHGGTLDPLATGILVVGVGSGTKSLSHFLGKCSKTYEATLLFGAASDTFDVCGQILKRGSYGHVTKELVEETLHLFRGKFMQKPPIFSAIKVNGKKLYEYARKGEQIPEVEERPVEVSELELLEFMPGGTHGQKYILENAAKEPEAPEEMKANADKLVEASLSKMTKDYLAAKRQQGEQEPAGEAAPSADLKRKRDGEEDQDSEPPIKKTLADESTTTAAPEITSSSSTASPFTDGTQAPAARVRITSSSGFYVRSLIHELAVAMDSVAVMTALKRTKQAHFELGRNVLEWDELMAGEQVWGPQVRQMLWEWMDAEESNGGLRELAEAALKKRREEDRAPKQRGGQDRRSPKQWEGQEQRSPKRRGSQEQRLLKHWEGHDRRESGDRVASPPRNQSYERRSRSRTPEKKGEAAAPAMAQTSTKSRRVELDEDDDWGDM